MASHLSGRDNPRFVPMEGKSFGLLTVLGLSHIDGQARWDCLCACGKCVKVSGGSLRRGGTKSCGCTRKINAPAAARLASTRHGMHRTPTYETWQSMLARCENPAHKSYKYYGGKGVVVCDSWHKFENFIADMGVRPDGKTIDRIDGHGNYVPGNCEWKTPKQQANNRRSNRLHKYLGETKTTKQWSEDQRCAVSFSTFAKRIDCGWPIEYAMEAPYRSVLKTLTKRSNA